MAAKRRERWYSIDGQRRNHRAALESTKGSRQLLSLVLLLVLVLIAIRQVSDPKRVGHAARAIGLLPTSDVSRTDTPNRPSLQIVPVESGDPANSQGAEGVIDPVLANSVEAWTLHSDDSSVALQSAILARLLVSASPEVVTSLGMQWLQDSIPEREGSRSSTDAVNTAPATAATVPDAAGQLPSIPDAELVAAWWAAAMVDLTRWTDTVDSQSADHATMTELLRSFQAFGPTGAFDPSAALDPPVTPSSPLALEKSAMNRFQRAMQMALDRATLTLFVDNTPWRTDERWPLIRTTQRALSLHRGMVDGHVIPAMIPGTSIPQLVTQTEIYRGHGVRVRGTLAQIDPIAAVSLGGLGTVRYQVLWLRPDDSSNQPIVIHLPTEIAAPASLLEKDQAVEVTGLLAKRRAYPSQRGGEVAPVIIAASIETAPEDGQLPPTLTSVQRLVMENWALPSVDAIWSPPLDTSGARIRIEQRIASRTPLLRDLAWEELESSTRSMDPQAISAFADSDLALGLLFGLSKVDEEIQLLTTAGPILTSDGLAQLERFAGTVVRAIRIPIAASTSPGLDWTKVFGCLVESESQGSSAPIRRWILATNIPATWLEVEDMRQPGVFYGLSPIASERDRLAGASDPSPTLPLMLCSTVQWRVLPSSATASQPPSIGPVRPAVPSGWQRLLDLGWDLGWLDTVEGLQGQPMTSREGAAFYSLLAAARAAAESSADPDSHTRSADSEAASSTIEPSMEILPLIQRAEGRKRKKASREPELASAGYRTKASVQVRRVQRVVVDSPEARASLGADHYFQLDGFADIGRARIEINYGEGTSPVVFEREFPITLVANEVPSWLLVDSGDATSSESQAWYPRTRVDVEGWFYRMWRYKTTQVSMETDDSQSQQGPLVVVDSIKLSGPVTPTNASQTPPQWVNAITIGIGALGALWIARIVRKNWKRR